jgi:hypothetical protein
VKNGFQLHPGSAYLLLVLSVVFFTKLYQRPGWNKWIYWAALVLAIVCTGFPPPVTTIGGLVGAIALVFIVYAGYKNQQQRSVATV